MMRIAQNATHEGELEDATHRGAGGTPGRGPYIVLQFRVDEDTVTRARFTTYGCPTAMACAEIVCMVSEGRRLAGIPRVTPADVTLLVGGVPEGKEHCPVLAVEALTQMAPLAA
jgi:nitrogen fixation NifU-like protein